MHFLANENFPVASVMLLRQSEHDVVHVAEAFPSVEDEVVLHRAREQQRILITFDRDYGELIFRRKLPAPAGILFMRFDPDTPTEPAELVLSLLQGGVELTGNFTVMTREEIRQRRLP